VREVAENAVDLAPAKRAAGVVALAGFLEALLSCDEFLIDLDDLIDAGPPHQNS
jgi:hypothetical protein